MDVALIIARFLQFAGAVSLAGVLGFVAIIAAPAFTPAGDGLPQRLRRRLTVLAAASAAVTFVGAALQLLFVAQSMSGDTLGAVLAQGVVPLVLSQTQFGQVSILRFAALVLLLPCLWFLGRRAWLDRIAALLALASLGAAAWQGHGGIGEGWQSLVHLAADAAHLLAAGLWVGGLIPLALALRAIPSSAHASRVLCYKLAARFSALGTVCVALLLATGAINSWVLVGSLDAFIATPYGRVLLLKLALVAAMLALATVNRWRLLPRLALASDEESARRIARNARIEAGLGLSILAVVGVLGTMMPGAHPAFHQDAGLLPFSRSINQGRLS